jgi:hypothetical protein
MPSYDPELVARLNNIWNNKESHRESRRHGPVKEWNLPFPVLNILGGVQPAYIASTFPEETWTTGLGRRSIMVFFGDTQPIRDPFEETEGLAALEQPILAALAALSEWFGQIEWTDEAQSQLQKWWLDGGGKPVPTHSKLAGYCRNRVMNISKLVGVSVASRNAPRRRVEPIDFDRAKSWLLEAESFMPDIFRAMGGKGDHAVMEELHRHLVAKWTANGHKSVSRGICMSFLASIVPGNKANEIMLLMESAGWIKRDQTRPTGDWFFPQAKDAKAPE